MSNAPSFIGPDPLPFPKELTDRRQWLCFDLFYEPGNNKLKKVPRNAATGGYASSNDPDTWVDYETALAAVRSGRFPGLGFALTHETGLAILDLENCLEGGVVAEWAQREVDNLDSFTEISASGTGLHVLCWGSVPSGQNRQGLRVELRGAGQMFCLTGITLPGQDVVATRDLLPLHARIERKEVGPNYHPPRIPVDVHSQKFRDSAADNWVNHYAGRSEAVQGVLCSLALAHGGDPDVIRQEFEKLPIRAAWVDAKGADKWERLGDSEIRHAVSFIIQQQAKDKASKLAGVAMSMEFAKPSVPSKVRDYTLKPLDTYDGWFPRGRVSIVGGSSGAGKTTFVGGLLESQYHGQSVLGHEGAELPYLLVFADRGRLANEETLERMGMDPRAVPIAYLPMCWGDDAVKQVCRIAEEQPRLPAIMFVEGADLLVEDASKTHVVGPFMKGLQRIAEHYHIAIVLSVGAPKSKPGEQHTLKRDRIFGSQIWTRTADTVVQIAYVGDGSGGCREIHVEHRNAPSESFEMEFQNGRLVQRQERQDDIDPLRQWIETLRDGEEWFTRPGAIEAMAKAGVDMKRTKVYERIKEMLGDGTLERDWHAAKKTERLRRKRTEAERKTRRQAELDPGFAGNPGTALL